MVLVLDRKITQDEFQKALEDYEDYIKVVVDIEKDVIVVGGEYHIDGEEVLIQSGSLRENLYGGGYRPSTKEVEYMAMSNYKPALGKTTYEITDLGVREKLKNLVQKFLEL